MIESDDSDEESAKFVRVDSSSSQLLQCQHSGVESTPGRVTAKVRAKHVVKTRPLIDTRGNFDVGSSPTASSTSKAVSEETFPHEKLKWLQHNNIK